MTRSEDPEKRAAGYEPPAVEDVEVKAGLVSTVPGAPQGTPPPSPSAPRSL